MCGLAGLWRPDGGEIDMTVLRRMTDVLAHRGPDGSGFHTEAGVGLGHRRLAIIDVAGGDQPMWNEDRSVAIVFNGEIYNFPELRLALQRAGHVFRNRCDTEAIVHAWEEWGPACLGHLDGMFAFALWDRNQQLLFLARDRLGKKPLHYAALPRGGLAFASELASFACIPSLSRAIDPQSVEDFLAFGYVPDPATVFGAIRKLPAAHYVLLGRGGTMAPPMRYWRPRLGDSHPDETAAIDALRIRMREATAARLIADVKLGAFLSGGIDSAGVVAHAATLRAEQNGERLDTFTVGFAGGEDETPYAARVASRYATRQHRSDAAAIDWIEAARTQARIFGEPFGDSSAVPTREVCALARRHATVALSGDGGDEVFAGYRRYRWHVLVDLVRAHVPARVWRGAIGTLAALYPKLDRAPRFLRARHTLHELSLDSALGYARTVLRIQDDRRRALLSASLRSALDGHSPHARIDALMRESDSDDPLAQAQYADLGTWLVGDILTKVDRASMACSLEVRAPLLDHRLVEWGLSLPRAFKLRGGEGKHILRRALEPYLDHDILYRRKQGFSTSLAAPLRARMGRVRARLLHGPMQECGLFDRSCIRRVLDEHASGASDHGQAIWQLLAFEGFLAHEAGLIAAPQQVLDLA